MQDILGAVKNKSWLHFELTRKNIERLNRFREVQNDIPHVISKANFSNQRNLDDVRQNLATDFEDAPENENAANFTTHRRLTRVYSCQ